MWLLSRDQKARTHGALVSLPKARAQFQLFKRGANPMKKISVRLAAMALTFDGKTMTMTVHHKNVSDTVVLEKQ
jgi:hypothetical protein